MDHYFLERTNKQGLNLLIMFIIWVPIFETHLLKVQCNYQHTCFQLKLKSFLVNYLIWCKSYDKIIPRCSVVCRNPISCVPRFLSDINIVITTLHVKCYEMDQNRLSCRCVYCPWAIFIFTIVIGIIGWFQCNRWFIL